MADIQRCVTPGSTRSGCARGLAWTRRRRRLGGGLPGRRAGGRHLGRVHRRGPDRPVAAGHDHLRLVGHQDDDGPVRADPGRPRRPRPDRAGGQVLARVRRRREGRRAGQAPAGAYRGAAVLGRADDGRGSLRLAAGHRTARRAGAALGTGCPGRLPRGHPGNPRRRGRPPGHRPPAGRLLRRGGGRPAGPDSHIGLDERLDGRVAQIIAPPSVPADSRFTGDAPAWRPTR